MNTIRATVTDGKIVVPADWPDGTEVVVTQASEAEEPIGLPDGDGPMTPEEIARVLALMDQVEGPLMSDEDRAAWDAARKEQKEYELARWEEESRRLERLFR